MATFRTRLWAKVIGYIELICSIVLGIIGLLIAGVAIAALHILTQKLKEKNDFHQEDQLILGFIITYLTLFLGGHLFVCVLHMYAAFKLIQSTDMNKSTREAHIMAVFWRNASWVTLCLTLAGQVLIAVRNGPEGNEYLYAIPVLTVIIRGSFLYIGITYIRGLAAYLDAGHKRSTLPWKGIMQNMMDAESRPLIP